MNFENYKTISKETNEQIKNVCEIWSRHLEKDLLGIYIHGSMALNCFLEGVSDIDILIVSNSRITREKRLLIAKDIINIDQKPCSLEMSALWVDDLYLWKYPTPCQFHYSDYWTEHYLKLLNGEIKESFIIDEDFKDSDIACHIHLTNQCGICVYGKSIEEVFPKVPEEDFWKSISNEIEDYDFHAYNPKYFASNILILGRILSYKKENRILSKYEGGLWTLNYVPEKFRYIIDDALKVWYMGTEMLNYNKEDLENLRKYLIDEIRKN